MEKKFGKVKAESVNEDQWRNTRIQSKNIFRMLKQKYNNNIPKMEKGLETILKQNKTKNDQGEIIRQEFKKYFKIKESIIKEAKNDNLYVVIDFHEKGGGFVMTKPSSKKLADDSARSITKTRDITKREVLKVKDARKIRGLAGKEYLKEESENEAKVKRPVNRWLELKNDETMHPHKKMAMGLKELKYQLRETEKFFNWYNKIKTMNELDSNQYWKRTNKHIYKIKERLVNIARTIQEIEK